MVQAVLSLVVVTCLPLCTGQSTSVCTTPIAPDNGKISSTNNNDGDSVLYACLQGYNLKGAAKRTCADGTWDKIPPTCNAKVVGDSCMTHLDCSSVTGTATCDGSSKCACNSGYIEDNGGCVSMDDGGSIGSGGSSELSRGAIAVIVVGSICGAVIIGLIIGIMVYKFIC